MSRSVSLLLLLLSLVSVSFGWRAVATTGPRPPFRSSPSWGVIPGTSDVYLFGGLYDNFNTENIMTNDLYHYSALNSLQGVWSQVHGWTSDPKYPSPRAFSGYTTTSAGLYVYGGAFYTNPFAPTTLGDFWLFNVNNKNWTQINATGTTPGARAASAMTTVGSDLYLFGGITPASVALNDLWKFRPSTNTWTQITVAPGSNPPPGMENHVMISFGNTVYVGFGETFENFQFGITVGMWSVNVASNSPTWNYINPPSTPQPPRNYVGAVTDSNGRVIIFGGDEAGGTSSCGSPFVQNPVNQTWVYSPLTNTWRESIVCPSLAGVSASFPFGIKRHRSLFVPTQFDTGVIYTFGGYGWNANSPDCATRQEWYGDIFALSYAELLAGLTCGLF